MAVRMEYRLSGPLFDPKAVERFKDAVHDGMAELADEASGVMVGYIHAHGFERTGQTWRSVTSEEHRDTPGGIGWFKVYPVDVWPPAGRPTRTWMEEGKRRGIKLRKGGYVFRKTAAYTNKLKYEAQFLERIARVLN